MGAVRQDMSAMDDHLTRSQKKEGSAVTDSMRYNIKPVAVRSENLLTSIKASNGNQFSGDGVTQVIFDVPAMAGGYYLDTATSRFVFNICLTDTSGTATGTAANGPIGFDRGPQSIINRWQLYDASGHLLEDIQNYHLLYAMTELCTNDPQVRRNRGAFFRECRNPDSLLTAANTMCEPSYGGVFFDNSAGGYSAINGNILTDVAGLQSVSLSFLSAIFGGGANKYYPLSAMNGFRIVLTLNTPEVAFISGANIVMKYKITDPTLYTNQIRVDPAVDRGLISSSRGRDGRIRIGTQSWRTYTTSVIGTDRVKNIVIPIAVSSLKALFWMFVDPAPSNQMSASSCYTRSLKDYQLFIGSIAIPTTPVQAGAPYNESFAELMRAWHVRLQDSTWSTLFTPANIAAGKADSTSLTKSNVVYGVELESMSNKNNVIESGANVLNTNVEVRMNFSADATPAGSTYNIVFFALHDVFTVIDPDTGITSLEF